MRKLTGFFLFLLLHMPLLGHLRMAARLKHNRYGTGLAIGRVMWIARAGRVEWLRARFRFLIFDFDDRHVYYGRYTTRQKPISVVRETAATGESTEAALTGCRHVHACLAEKGRLLVALGDSPDEARIEVFDLALAHRHTLLAGTHARVIAFGAAPAGGYLIGTDISLGPNFIYQLTLANAVTVLARVRLPMFSSLSDGETVFFGTANENYRKALGLKRLTLELHMVRGGAVRSCQMDVFAVCFPRSAYPEVRPVRISEHGVSLQFLNCWPSDLRYHRKISDFLAVAVMDGAALTDQFDVRATAIPFKSDTL